jgi:alpha-N-acetylglucosaminidase
LLLAEWAFPSSQVESTWKMLVDSIYTKRRRYPANKISMERPKMLAAGNRPYIKQIANGYKQVGRAWASLLSNPSNRDSYKFDIVNLGRQVLGEYFPKTYYAFCDAYDAKDTVAMRISGREMMEVIKDMDRLLACHRTFSLEDWNNASRSWGDTPSEKDYYEENARAIITYWGGSGGLTDYAERQWSGMMSSYYGYRWSRFIEEAIAAVKTGKPFDQIAFNKEMRAFEIAWTKPSHKIDYPKASDPLAVSKEIAYKLSLL